MPIGAAIGVGQAIGGLFTGRSKAKAAQKAAELQAQAAEQARQDLLAGGRDVRDVGVGAGRRAIEAGEMAGTDVRATSQAARDRLLEQMGFLDPYSATGGTAAAQAAQLTGQPVERFAFDPSSLGTDPGYLFRKAEAQKTMLQNAAALGNLQSGGFAKEFSDRASQEASQEAANQYGRQLSTFQANQLATQQRIANLLDMMGFGERAARLRADIAAQAGQLDLTGATTAGDFRTNAARTAGGFELEGAGANLNAIGAGAQLLTDAARARAGGIIGANNAMTGAVGGLINQAGGLDFGRIFRRRK